MPFAVLPDAKVYYEEYGSGEALLISSCGKHLGNAYRDAIPILADQYRVIHHEWPGMGQSEGQFAPFERAVGTAEALLDALGLDQAALVGDCMAANIYLGLASRSPERVSKLFMADLYAHPFAGSRDLPETHVYKTVPANPEEWARFGAFLVLPNGRTMLQQLQVPAMLLYGDQDPLAMEEGYRDEISVNPRTPVLSWPGVRHMGMHEPEEFAGVVMEFFASPSQPVHRVWQNVRPSSIPAGVRSWC